jgi:hypothetical protein
MGVPKAPNATGAVLAISARPDAYSGGKPAPIMSAAEIATGVPNPAAPSMNAPKLNAMSIACTRRSGDSAITECLIFSNSPVSTVSEYRNTAINTIQPMGNKPKAAPKPALARAAFTGMP